MVAQWVKDKYSCIRCHTPIMQAGPRSAIGRATDS